MKIFNLFKKKEVKEKPIAKPYHEQYDFDNHRIVVKDYGYNGNYKWSVFDYDKQKDVIHGYCSTPGEAYSEAVEFCESIKDVDITGLVLIRERSDDNYLINRDDAVRLLEEYKDKEVYSIDFHDYSSDKHFSFDKSIVHFFILDGYYE